MLGRKNLLNAFIDLMYFTFLFLQMPLFHFGFCLALACGPVLLTYKYSGL